MRESTSGYGLNQSEFLSPKDPHFLRVGHSTIPPCPLVFQLTEVSKPIGEFHDKPYGEGIIIVEMHDASDGYHEQGIHESKVIWER